MEYSLLVSFEVSVCCCCCCCLGFIGVFFPYVVFEFWSWLLALASPLNLDHF